MSLTEPSPKITKKATQVKEPLKKVTPVAPPSITEDQFKHRRQKRYFKLFGKPKD